MEYLLIAFVCFILGYWRGLISGVDRNLSEKLQELMRHLPINVEIYESDGIYYCSILNLGTFIGQSAVKQDVLDMAMAKFPNRDIVVSYIRD